MTFKILVTNDDGINAPGLKIAEQIAHKIAGKKGKVITVAPSIDQSGVGHGISYLRPSLISKHNDKAYSVEGSPADCILAGIYHIMDGNKPDLILSGVNKGHNLAEDILYSGTIGAALEGALQGVKSIALSQCYSKKSLLFKNSFDAAQSIGEYVCCQLLKKGTWNTIPYQTFYNVNFPPVKESEVKGIRICKQGRRANGIFSMDPIVSPNGRTFLMVNHQPNSSGTERVRNYAADWEEIKSNYITITPLKGELTETNELEHLGNTLNHDY